MVNCIKQAFSSNDQAGIHWITLWPLGGQIAGGDDSLTLFANRAERGDFHRALSTEIHMYILLKWEERWEEKKKGDTLHFFIPTN